MSLLTSHCQANSPVTMIADFDFSAISIMEVLVPKKGGVQGAKIAPILYKGQPINFLLGSLEEPVRIPFPVSTFDRNPAATRVNMVLEVNNPAFQAFFKEFDEAIIRILTNRSTEFVQQKSLSHEQVSMCYKPCLNHSPPYSPNVKCKINIGDDANQVTVWNDDGKNIDIPQLFRKSKVTAELTLRAVWLASNMCGLSLQSDHIMLCQKEADTPCPFHSMLVNLTENELIENTEEDDRMSYR